MDIQWSQQYLRKRVFLPQESGLETLAEKKNQWTINVRVNSRIPNSIPLIFRSIVIPVSHCPDSESFVVNFEIGKQE